MLMSSVATSMPQGKRFVDETDPIRLRFLKSLQKEKKNPASIYVHLRQLTLSFAVLGIQPRTLQLQGRCFTNTKLHPQAHFPSN